MTTILEVRQANRKWFGGGNKKFFGDICYRVLHSKTGKPYLARKTHAWSDIFGKKRVIHWRLNPIGELLEIRPLIDNVFPDLWAVKKWLKDN